MSADRPRLGGIHHVTAIAREAARNVAFYRDLLGLRLVKRTVNFDAPQGHHLYYGDGEGRPGSLLTFFPLPNAARGTDGSGMASRVSLAVPEGSLDFWTARLSASDTSWQARSGGGAIQLADPDGLALELRAVQSARFAGAPWEGGGVPAEHAIRRIHSVALVPAPDDLDVTRWMFEDVLGFTVDEDPVPVPPRELGGGEEPGSGADLGADPEAPQRARHDGPGDAAANDRSTRRLKATAPAAEHAEVTVAPMDAPAGRVAAGSVHHIAWRVPDDATQAAWLERLREFRLFVTDVKDRRYFRSIYVREPGGVLLEIATDGPGMTVDESMASLGTSLQLPPWLEQQRDRIESRLPPLDAVVDG